MLESNLPFKDKTVVGPENASNIAPFLQFKFRVRQQGALLLPHTGKPGVPTNVRCGNFFIVKPEFSWVVLMQDAALAAMPAPTLIPN